MPRDDLAGDALGGLFRFLGRMLVEPVFELPIKGVGDGVLRVLRPVTNRPKPRPPWPAC